MISSLNFLVYGLCFIKILSMPNLITYGDFQYLDLGIRLSANFTIEPFEFYVLQQGLNFLGGWYPVIETSFQIRIKPDYHTLMLDVLGYKTESNLCQNVTLPIQYENEKVLPFSLSFDYLNDRNMNETNLTVLWNGQAILFKTNTAQYSQRMSLNVFASLNSTTNVLCFYGKNQVSNHTVGTLIDNVTLVKQWKKINVSFQISASLLIINTLVFTSDYSLQTQQLAAFQKYGIIVQINGNKVNKTRILNVSSKLAIEVEYAEEIYQQAQAKVIMPDAKIKNIEQQFLYFTVHTSALPKAIYFDESEAELVNNYFPTFVYYIKLGMLSFNAISIIGFPIIMARFLNFSNIMIFFVFLDIDLMVAPVRTVLEEICKLVLGEGTINFLLAEFGAKPLNFKTPFFSSHQIHEMPKINSHGMEFSQAGMQTNFYQNSIEDILATFLNIFKLGLFYFIFKIKCLRKYRKNTFNRLSDIIIYEFFSISPCIVAIAGVRLSSFSNVSYFSFNDKINCLFTLVSVIVFINISITIAIKLKVYPKQGAEPTPRQSEKQDRISVLVQKFNTNSQKSKIRKNLSLKKLNLIENLSFVLIPLLAGFSNTPLFLTVIIVLFLLKIKNLLMAKSALPKVEFYSLLSTKIIEILIHLIFTIFCTYSQFQTHLSHHHFPLKILKKLAISLPFLYVIGCMIQLLMSVYIILHNLWRILKPVCFSNQKNRIRNHSSSVFSVVISEKGAKKQFKDFEHVIFENIVKIVPPAYCNEKKYENQGRDSMIPVPFAWKIAQNKTNVLVRVKESQIDEIIFCEGQKEKNMRVGNSKGEGEIKGKREREIIKEEEGKGKEGKGKEGKGKGGEGEGDKGRQEERREEDEDEKRKEDTNANRNRNKNKNREDGKTALVNINIKKIK